MGRKRRDYPCSQGTSDLLTEKTCKLNGITIHVLPPWTESFVGGGVAESVGWGGRSL